MTVDVATRLITAGPAIGETWPGFWSGQPAFLVLRPTETALLVTEGPPPNGYVPLPDSAVPEPLHSRSYLRTEYPPDLGSNTFSDRYPVGRDTIPALEPKGGTRFDQINFYIHEAFHGWQRARWTATPDDQRRARFGQPLADSSQTAGRAFLALGEVERAVLSAALDTADRDSLVTLLRGYLAVRGFRTRDRPDVVAIERRMERAEGTATYVGCHAAALALEAPRGQAVACIRRELRKPLAEMPGLPESDAQLMRWRQYGTGAALSVLLDRLDVEWKRRVEGGTSLDALLTEAVA